MAIYCQPGYEEHCHQVITDHVLGPHLGGTGIIQLVSGCGLKIKERILSGTINHKGAPEIIYAPLLHLKISQLVPAPQEFQEYLPIGKSMSDQMTETTSEDKVFENNERSFEQ